MTKAEINALGRVWEAEVAGAVGGRISGLFQSKAAIYKRLASEGLLEFKTETVGADRFGAIRISGYELTHAGRMLYCSTCADEPDPA